MKFFFKDIKKLDKNVNNIRNICIVAHVDHGKTSLADALLVSNGIVSNRMCGKIRYMDSRKDEQERGITMKSSSIALGHFYKNEEYLINLIDSPGHVDFTGEVSTAIRLCDGAIVVVDVIEGICSQTKAALKQTWSERIKPILVLNKIDRLILEKKLTPMDAYIHLQQILEQINAFVGELFTTDVFMKMSSKNETKILDENLPKQQENITYDWDVGLDDKDDDDLYFMPEKNNVIFASAVDGWGFTISSFSKYLFQKLKISESALNHTLWGDYYINIKQKKILKGAQNKAKKPLFVSFVLENIWSVYDTVFVRKDSILTEKIINTFNLKLSKRDLNSPDAKFKLQYILQSWLPLSEIVLDTICKLLPCPKDLTNERIERFMCLNLTNFDKLPEKSKKLKSVFKECGSSEKLTKIVYVSKMFAVDRNSLPEIRYRPLTIEEINARRELIKNQINEVEKSVENLIINETNVLPEKDENIFIAFARVFSGTISKGDVLYVLGPKHDPSKIFDLNSVKIAKNLNDLATDQHITEVKIENIYMLMGRELESIESASAGNIIGLQGLENHVLRTATLTNDIYCPAFTDFHFNSQPILRVALEPSNPSEMNQLIKGLKLLNQADPCVEVKLQNTGEHVIVTTGEVHLQRCIDDLVERFAKIQINVSDPIVPFRETIVPKPKLDMVNEAIVNSSNANSSKEEILIYTQNKKCSIRLKAVPLPEDLIKLLEKNFFLIKFLLNQDKNNLEKISETLLDQINRFESKLNDAFKSANNKIWKNNLTKRIWSIGSKTCLTNILLNYNEQFEGKSIFNLDSLIDDLNDETSQNLSNQTIQVMYNNYFTNFINGFHMATAAGPLCEEPMMGVCFIILDWKFENERIDKQDPYGPLSGQIMSTVKEGCRKAFQLQPQRLCSPTFSCTIQVSSDMLGKMYGVINRRHGRIQSEEMQEGSQTFIVTSVLPVIESLQFANEIRKQTSGMAVPQLVFSHWEVIDIDPFWIPTTEEEYLHFGEKADSMNRAKKYVDNVRKRKGLQVDEKIVEHAEKQRTLSKK